jgi:hypothetical protein
VTDIAITGIPRSGTSLLAALVDGLEDAVCLSEPPWQIPWFQGACETPVEAVDRVVADFAATRRRLLAGEPVRDRRAGDGTPVTNYFRAGEVAYRIEQFTRASLTSDFLLAIKHNAQYTSVLPDLVRAPRLQLIAVVRHPVPTILSWRSLRIPISEARLPASDRFWPEIAAAARASADVLEAQVRIFELFCARYEQLRDSLTLVRYEDLVREPEAVSRLAGRAVERPVEIRTPVHDRSGRRDEIVRIQRLVEKHAPATTALYPDLERW